MIFVAIFVTSLFDQVDFCQAAFCTFWFVLKVKWEILQSLTH